MSFNPSYIGARTDMASLISGKNFTILDIGCSDGSNGEYLKNSGIAEYVAGVEFDHNMSVQASKVLDKVIEGSIADSKVLTEIPDFFYDYILFGDILEHLDNPWDVLTKLATKLKDSGKVVISIPNSGHIDVAIHLLFKKTWPVNERGIFDKTHRRFFAKNDIAKFIGGGGALKLVSVTRKYRYRDAMNSKFPFYGKILKLLFPDWYTFQFLILAEKAKNNVDKKVMFL